MVWMQQNFQQLIEQLKGTLGKLGARKLIALGLVGAALMSAILYMSIYLGRPSYETLYVGLSRDDVNRMGLALGEAGIPFDVKSDGSSILVPIGKAENARMYLAERACRPRTMPVMSCSTIWGRWGLRPLCRRLPVCARSKEKLPVPFRPFAA